MFANAHGEAKKFQINCFLALDTENRLPVLLKWRYINYFDKKDLNLSRLWFDSLRDFVVYEIKLMTLDCAQAIFKSYYADKEAQSSSRSKGYRVHQVTVGSGNDQKSIRSVPVIIIGQIKVKNALATGIPRTSPSELLCVCATRTETLSGATHYGL